MAGVPSAKSTGDDADRATPSAKDRAGAGDPISAPADDGEPVPMSLDRDASDRSFDRQLAHLGLLDDAAPLFREGSLVPGVGVLIALPCLVESGLFRFRSATAKNKNMARPRALLHHLLRHHRQRIKALAHVGTLIPAGDLNHADARTG